MCLSCEIETEAPPAPTWSRSRLAEVAERVRLENLERNRQRPEPFPICIRCEHPVDPTEADEIYRRQCVTCGLNKLEHLFRRLSEARGRKARKKATRRLVRFARTRR